MIVLDTSALIELVNDSEKGKAVAKYIENEQAGITVITLNEVLITASPKEEQVFEKIFNKAILLPFNIPSARKSIEIEKNLRKKGSLIGKLDIFIAGTCIAHGDSLITCDGDFKKVEGLNAKIV